MATLTLMTLLAVACGDNGDNGVESGTAPKEAVPERIVSLSPAATEMLFAIGAGDQVVAVDDQSDYPEDVPKTDLSGFQPNVEAIAGYEPDLVVISNDTGDLVSSLEELDIEVLLQAAPVDLDGAYSQIKELGTATGHTSQAAELVEEMKVDIKALLNDLPDDVAGMTYYHELDAGLFSVTSATFIGAVYGLMGLENIADAVDDPQGGYPQLSAEFIVEADPDFVFLADAEFGESPEKVAARPGWESITAVENDTVIAVDADLSSRWGPRVVDFIRLVAKALAKHEIVDR
jgi:iron complex transport system substrate-binding protein